MSPDIRNVTNSSFHRDFKISSHLALVKSSVYPKGIIFYKDRLRKPLNQKSYSFDRTAALEVGYLGEATSCPDKILNFHQVLLTYLYPLEVILELPPIPGTSVPLNVLPSHF